MNKLSTLVCVLVFGVTLSSCYHVQVNTGKTPSADVIDIPWATSLIGGLVPPKVVETAEDCPNGVALVESKLSFLNLVVAAVTFSIYTPMHITVTCAANSMMTENPDGLKSITLDRDLPTEEKVKSLTNELAGNTAPLIVSIE